MKKLLALVLALVMTLGLATVGANAALSDFSDGSETAADYQEALGVMNMVGVFQGDTTTGTINPTKNLTRAEAAKLIAYLDLGETAAETLPAKQVFSDVPADNWAAKYVAYCAEQGIIQGADGKFLPNEGLSGYAFGAYLLAVLGYDRNTEGVTGANWEIAAAKLMGRTGIGGGVDKAGSATLTRQEGAQYCFEALKAECVDYNGQVKVSTADGTKVDVGGAQPITNNIYIKLNNVDPEGAFVSRLQLGEKLYGDKLEVNLNGRDAANRPANIWTYKASGSATKTVSFAGAADLTVENKNVSASALTKLLKDAGYTLDAANTVYANGDDAATGTFTTALSNAQLAALTGPGAVVEFFDTDDDKDVDQVFVTVQQIAKLTAANIHKAGSDGTPRYITLGGYNYVTDDFAAGDYIVYTYSAATDTTKLRDINSTTKERITSASLATSFTGKASALGVSNGTTVSVTVDGTTYAISRKGWDQWNTAGFGTAYQLTDDSLVKDAIAGNFSNSWTLYQDTYGNVIKADVLEENATTDYVFVSTYQINGDSTSLSSSVAAYANVIFTDGVNKTISLQVKSGKVAIPSADATSVITYTINADTAGSVSSGTEHNTLAYSTKYAANQWYAYTENSDGTYTLKAINPDYAFQTTDSDNSLPFTANTTYAVASDTTTYYTAKDTTLNLIDDSGHIQTKTGFVGWTVAVKASTPILVTYPKSSSAVAASAIYMISGSAVTTTSASYAYAVKKDADIDDGQLWTFAVDGKQEQFQISDGTPTVGKIYQLSVDTSNSGYYTAGTPVPVRTGRVTFVSGKSVVLTSEAYAGETAVSGAYTLADDCKIYNTDKMGSNTVETSEIGTPVDELAANMGIMFVYNTSDDSEIIEIWVADGDRSNS